MSPSTARRTVVVTGGGGFVGNSVVRALLDDGWQVRNLDYVATQFTDPNLTHWPGSFLDHTLIREVMVGADAVVHLAASGFAREANEDPYRDCQDNVLGTIHLLEQAVDAGVGRFVFASSGGTVYGPTDAVPVVESHPTNPLTAYGISKLACEKYLRFFDGQRGISTLTLRVSNPYGPNQNTRKGQGALTLFCQKAVEGGPIEIWGDGTVERDFIAVADVAEAFVAALNRPEVHGREINIASGQGTSLNRIIEVITELTGEPLQVAYVTGRSFDVQRNYLDIGAARDLLGWSPRVVLTEGIRDLLAALRGRP